MIGKWNVGRQKRPRWQKHIYEPLVRFSASQLHLHVPTAINIIAARLYDSFVAGQQCESTCRSPPIKYRRNRRAQRFSSSFSNSSPFFFVVLFLLLFKVIIFFVKRRRRNLFDCLVQKLWQQQPKLKCWEMAREIVKCCEKFMKCLSVMKKKTLVDTLMTISRNQSIIDYIRWFQLFWISDLMLLMNGIWIFFSKFRFLRSKYCQNLGFQVKMCKILGF